MTWDCVDWRTYTTALRLRTVAGSSSELVIFKLLDIEAGRLRQDLSQYQDGRPSKTDPPCGPHRMGTANLAALVAHEQL